MFRLSHFYHKICCMLCIKLSVNRKERCLIFQSHGYTPVDSNQKHSIYRSIGTSVGETRYQSARRKELGQSSASGCSLREINTANFRRKDIYQYLNTAWVASRISGTGLGLWEEEHQWRPMKLGSLTPLALAKGISPSAGATAAPGTWLWNWHFSQRKTFLVLPSQHHQTLITSLGAGISD